MKAIQIKEYVKGPSDLKPTTVTDPTPKPNEYLIAVHAAAANYFDLLQIRGKYQEQPPLPWVSGFEFAGVVLRAPSKVPNGGTPKFKAGDRVFGYTQGAFATLATAVEDRLLPVPEQLDMLEASSLFVATPTAHIGLVTRAGIKAGDWVLVHAAAGGVGLAAVQIAKAFGATVVATASTQHKLDIAKKFGADFAVDYTAKDWAEQVKRLTPKGRGVDIVYDPVGMVSQSMKCAAWNGRLLIVGFTGGSLEKVATNRILLKNVSVVGLNMNAYFEVEPETMATAWDSIFELIRSTKYKSTRFTDSEYVGLESVGSALEALEARHTWGKVVVKVPQQAQSKI